MDDSEFPHDQSESSEATQIVDSAALKRVREQITQRSQAYLMVIAGPHSGAMLKVDRNETILGRSDKSDLTLQDVGISRSHVRVSRVGDQVFVEDLQSANGTYVNGQRLSIRHELQEGDKIAIGASTIIKFSLQDGIDEDYQLRITEAALKDALIGAFNKKYFSDNIYSEFSYAKRHSTHLCLVMFDIDHFKNTNDTFGHLAGDYILANLGRLAHGMLRAEDVFARYGGEEFAVILRGITMYQGYQLAERIRAGIARFRFEYDGQHVPVTISMGVASFPEIDVQTPDELIAAADGALYAAKRSGRNRVEMAT
jgi:diguanylate cyclase (GGDEF)-like protein